MKNLRTIAGLIVVASLGFGSASAASYEQKPILTRGNASVQPPSRQNPWNPEGMTPEQFAIYERYKSTMPGRPDGYLGGPWDILLLNPPFLEIVQSGASILWEGTSLDRGLVEFIICATSVHWKANVEWVAHAPRAARFGVSQAVLDELLKGGAPTSGTRQQKLAYELVHTMSTHRRISRELFDAGIDEFGERGLMEIMSISGFYVMVAMNLNAFEMQPPPGESGPFERLQ